MKKIVKLKETDLMNIIKKVMNEARPVPTGANKHVGPKKTPACHGDLIVYTGNGCTTQCNGPGGYIAAQGSATIGNACSNPPVTIQCICAKGGITDR